LHASRVARPGVRRDARAATEDFAARGPLAILPRSLGISQEDDVTMVENSAANAQAPTTTKTPPANPLEDGRTRCSWVAGRPEHYSFHDAEFGMVPDTDDLARERVFLACLMRDMPLVDALDRRQALWDAFKGYDVKTLESLDDSWTTSAVEKSRLAWLRDVAKVVAATTKDYKDFREYFLAVRFMPAEEQFAEMASRFPGFTKQDAANLMELAGTVEGMPHERDCWRA
jgi:3-methyladenine DNA glycosylase Tag